MAKYTDRLNQLVEDGVLTQEQHDELADLSVAKDAIKEFNQIKAERDELATKVQTFETQPKRKAALEKFGIDYTTSKKYLRDVFDKIPADKLEDADFISQHLRDNEVEVTAGTEQTPGATPAAARVDAALNTGGASSEQSSYEQAVGAAQTPEELDQVYARFGKAPAQI